MAGPTDAVDLTPEGRGTLLLMHVPKSAGTFLRASLGRAYGRSERVFLYDPQHVRGAVRPGDFGALPEERRRDLRLVLGHFRYGVHTALPGPSAYVTVMRDPVDRVVSVYSHHLRHWGLLRKLLRPGLRDGSPAAREGALIRSSGLSLEQWVFERGAPQADNAYVRLISGHQDVAFGEVDESMLAEAIEHIDARFAGLLVQEQMDRSLRLLGSMIGRPLRPARARNANKERLRMDTLDPALRARIEELNRFDLELHRLAAERLGPLTARYTA